MADIYHKMQGKGELIRYGFDITGITDVMNVDYLMAETPFDEDDK